MPEAPSLFPLPALHAAPTPDPLPLSSLPRTPERLQKPPAADLASFPLRFSSPSAPHAIASQLPTKHVCIVLRSSPPRHRKSEPMSTSNPRLLGEPVLRASWLSIGVCLTLSLLLRHYRTPPLMPPITGAPPPLLDITASPPRHPCTSSHCSGEPLPPPPHQVHCRRPSGARAAFPETPCPPEHVDQPRHPPPRAWPQRGDHAASPSDECVPLPHRGPPPRLDRAARLWPSRLVGRPRVAGRHTSHCSPRPVSSPALCLGFKRFSICFK
jgi:hypothetical protein